MKPFKSFLLSVILFVTSVSSQCPQTINQTDVVRLFRQLDIGADDEDPNNYVQQNITVLCYTANSTLQVNTSTIRASFLYDLGAGTDLSFIASFYCTNDFEWRFNTSFPSIKGSGAEYYNNTFDRRSDCLNCYDNSGIADPSWCSLPDLCDSGYCENGGSCNRTDLDAYDCTCAGSWSGTTCTDCGLSCVNGGMLINTACTCECPGNFDGDMCENCGLSCVNGGMLNSTTCTCECPGNFNGDMCEDCGLSCVNGGMLNSTTCTCECPGNFNGDMCEDCGLSCVNGGMLNSTTCTCECPGNFNGDMCEDCGLSCVNGGMLNSTTCTCECPGNFNGDMCEVGNTPATNPGLQGGAIAGIVIGVILFLAIIIAAVIIIVVIVIMRR